MVACLCRAAAIHAKPGLPLITKVLYLLHLTSMLPPYSANCLFECSQSITFLATKCISAFFPLRAHSQKTITRHPSFSNALVFRRSLSMLASNFAVQNFRCVSGIVDALQPCLCQKHP